MGHFMKQSVKKILFSIQFQTFDKESKADDGQPGETQGPRPI